MRDDLLLVGRVARAHGNKGQVIVNPETDFPDERFRAGQELLVGPEGKTVVRRIRDARFHQGRPIVGFEGVDTMNDAEALAGAELWVPAATLAPLPEGTHYRHDLIGCEVHDTFGARVGVVRAVEGPIERSHLIVEAPGGDVMVPMVGGICVSIDTAARRIVIDPPDGLIGLNARQ
jgi:16S rRNA processing protein RimM